VENASSVSIEPGIPAAPATGTDKVAPMVTTTYVLTATNRSGSTTASTVVTVGGTGGIPQTPEGMPVITSFYANPVSVNAGGASMLTWNTSNATGARISGIGNVAVSGSQAVYPTATTTYVLEAFNGTNSSSASASVAVSPYSTPPPTPPSSGSLPTILSFTASPSSVAVGGSTTLYWDTLNATSASISSYGSSAYPVATSGSMPITTSGTGSITFNLTATNAYGSSYASTVVVSTGGSSPPPTPSGSPPTAALYLSTSSIASGAPATISWMTTGASSVSISNGVKSLTGVSGASGSVTVYPTSTTTYTLTATNAYGSTYAAKTLTVTGTVPFIPVLPPALPTAAIYLSQSNITAGTPITISWATTGATSVSISNGVKSLTGVSGASGSITVTPTTTTTYTLTATNTTGSNYASKTVTVH
jgi:hypothetical protein